MNINHGDYLIRVEDNMVILTLSGEFNELSVQAYVAEIQLTIEKFENSPFLMLVDNLALVGATPEAYKESDHHNHWLSTTNMLGKATVYPSSFLADVDSARVSSKKRLNCKNFESISAAKKWLNNHRS